MKKILFTLILVISVGLMTKINSQCTISNVAVKLNSSLPSGNNCIINFDMTFDLEHNMGNKYDWIHMWLTSAYPTLPYNNPPTAAQLAGNLVNIGINDNTGGAPVFLTSYAPDPAVPVQVPSSITKIANPGGMSDHFIITGISVAVPSPCNMAVSITGDLWSSQSSSQNHVHCFNQNVQFYANDPNLTGLLFCATPHQYNVTISTVRTSLSGTYNVYRDDDLNGVISLADVLVATNVAWSATNTTPYQSGLQSYAGNGTKPQSEMSLIIEATTVGQFSKNVFLIANTCIPLPVKFSSFTAQRNQSTVKLVWQTTTEINNLGFSVERNVNGSWNQIAFVPSQAAGSNSSSMLTYSYNDQNTLKGVSQYRISQESIDNKPLYSEIRAIRGSEQPGKTIIYPNPSFNDKVNVVFEESSGVRDIVLMDMSGRTIRSWKGISNNILLIDNLNSGFYNLRISVRETGVQTTEKFIVNKR